MCMTKCVLIIFVLFMVMPSMWAQPTKSFASHVRKSCGRDLVERVERICRNRGGHMTYTRAHRIRRGIVDECCMNKCADHHIYAYCSNNKANSEPKSEPMLEIPAALTMDLVVDESRVPAASRIMMDNENENTIPLESGVTSAPVERFTLSPDHRYHDIIVKNNVDTEYVNRLIKTLPYSSNDFQVGTVPPEYMISRYIPSRARTVSNYQY